MVIAVPLLLFDFRSGWPWLLRTSYKLDIATPISAGMLQHVWAGGVPAPPRTTPTTNTTP